MNTVNDHAYLNMDSASIKDEIEVYDDNNNRVLVKNSKHTSNVNAITNDHYTYEKVKSIADWIMEKVSIKPKVGIVCGSGLGGLGDRLESPNVIPYSEIPNFPSSTVVGHKGNLIFGLLNKVPVVCMQGRFHAYEGYSNALCTMPMKVFKLLGIESVVLTCAAGGINESFHVGDIMVIKDHIAPLLWTLQNPLVGHNDERFGPRFPAANRIYTKSLRDIIAKIADEKKVEIKTGVYSSLGGPCYETVSELRGLAQLGADSVGMSTAHEALVASYCGMQVLAIALITNKAVLDYDSEEFPNHAEVIETANKRAIDIESLIIEFVSKI
jgi:purine-nucleoside phosphorylase